MTENEIKNTKKWFEDFIETYALSNQETIEFKKAVACLEEIQKYRAIGTIEEFRQAMRFKEYFMELCDEGLEVANWHKNGDLEPLVNFIDEACS